MRIFVLALCTLLSGTFSLAADTDVFAPTQGSYIEGVEIDPCGQWFICSSCYIATKGALNFYVPPHRSHRDRMNTRVGAFMSLAQGWSFDDCWRMEGEIGAHFNRPKTYHRHDGTGTHHFRGNYIKFLTVMANAYYDFPCICEVRPYLGLGTGYAYETIKLHYQDYTHRESSNRLAWQAMAGILYNVACGFHLGLEYRYFGAHPRAQTHDLGVLMQYHY